MEKIKQIGTVILDESIDVGTVIFNTPKFKISFEENCDGDNMYALYVSDGEIEKPRRKYEEVEETEETVEGEDDDSEAGDVRRPHRNKFRNRRD